MMNKPITVSVDLLDPDPVFQMQESRGGLIELALRISANGLVEPIIVKENNGRYPIMIGVRKFMAAKLAGLTEVEIFMIPEFVEDIFNLAAGNDQQQRLTDVERYVTLKLLLLSGPNYHKCSFIGVAALAPVSG